MKSCLGLLIAFTFFVAVIGGGALLYYLSTTSEFSRTGQAAPQDKPPVAIPVR
ncbi:MAG: hypothetical protein WEB53_08460 [Akkermansiaceae bacterium]